MVVHRASTSYPPFQQQFHPPNIHPTTTSTTTTTKFRDDVAVNPNDTEESIWAFMCEARLLPGGAADARARMLVVGRDSRPYMRAAYEAFRDGAGPAAIAAAAGPDPEAGPSFYSLLYQGLYAEAHGDAAAAREAMRRACATQYARRSGDFMANVCRIHCLRRGWM